MEQSVKTPKYIVLMAEDTFSPLFWDDEDCGIGDALSVTIGNDNYSLSSLTGIKEWFLQADKYDPFTEVTLFTCEGMKEWIDQGYEYAKQIRSFIPKSIKLYYAFHHQFGDGQWRLCKAYIA